MGNMGVVDAERAERGWKNRVRRLSRELIQPSDVMSNLVDGLCPGPAPTPALPPWRCPAVALPLPCPERRTPTRSANGPPRPYQQSTTTTNQPPMNQPPTTTAQSTVQSLNHCTRLPRTRTVMTNTNYLMFLFFFVSNYEVPIKTPAGESSESFFLYTLYTPLLVSTFRNLSCYYYYYYSSFSSAYLSNYLFICLEIYLSVCPSTCLFLLIYFCLYFRGTVFSFYRHIMC